VSAGHIQPTDPHYVWGRRQDRLDRRFQGRAVIVDNLISRWTSPDWSAVDVSGGAGWLSVLAPRFEQFSHLDLSPDALEAARAENPEYSHVEYGMLDLLKPTSFPDRTWDVVFCLDTLLYSGDFVEVALHNIRSLITPRGVAIIDLPGRLRASISRVIKGSSYGGPPRTFSPNMAKELLTRTSYTCLDIVYYYRELTVGMQTKLVQRRLTGSLPYPSTWMYLVLRPRLNGQ
jgi:SAM-dependent methyltransferase